MNLKKDSVKHLALEAGFKLKEQPDGSLDLNPYVYEFAHRILESNQGNKEKKLARHFRKINRLVAEGVLPYSLGESLKRRKEKQVR